MLSLKQKQVNLMTPCHAILSMICDYFLYALNTLYSNGTCNRLQICLIHMMHDYLYIAFSVKKFHLPAIDLRMGTPCL